MSWFLLFRRLAPDGKARIALRRGASRGLALAMAAAAGLALAGCGGEPTATPTPEESSRPISFTAEDGLEIQGRLFGQGDVGVVLAHMYPADQTSWWDFAGTLAENGYMALAFDFRGYGQSSGSKEITLIDLDVEAAVDFLKAQGASTVFLAGASMGGTASLKVAANRSEDVSGVVSLSAPINFKGISVEEEQIRVPVLLMVASKDGSAKESLNEMIGLGIVAQTAESVVYEESGDHGTDLLEGDHGDVVRGRILSFLQANHP